MDLWAGGSGSANNATIGGIGSSSSFGSISASGGGGGASGYNPQTGASSGYTGGGGELKQHIDLEVPELQAQNILVEMVFKAVMH